MPRNIKVLHILNMHEVGGAETAFVTYLHGVQDERFEHHVLVLGRQIHPHFRRAVHSRAASVGFAGRLLSLNLPKRPRFLRRARLVALAQKVSPDVVHLYGRWGAAGLADLARHSRRPAAAVHFEWGGAWFVKDAGRVRRYIPKLGAAIACSQAARRMMELQWQCPSSLIRLCYQPTRFGALSSGDAPTTLPSGRPVRIGFAGKLCFHKAPAVALHTLARLKQSGGLYELHVAGAGLELEGLQALARRLGLARDVVFHGLVRDMRPFFRSIHLLLCPSVCEPQGLVLAEAAGFGCPAVATLVDGIPETVVDGETGYCVRPELPVESYEDLGGQMGNPQQLPARCYDPSTDAPVPVRLCRPEALAEAVSRLCADGARFRVLSAQARELAAQKFSASVYVDTLSRYLAESAGGR